MNFCVLDVGNVLVHVDFQVFVKELSLQLNLTLEEVEYFLNRTQRLHDMGLTKMADELRDHFKIKSPLMVDNLLNVWDKIIRSSISISSFFKEMKRDYDLQIALLSNIGLEHAEKIEIILGDLFADSIKHLSCKVGARKPSMLYYQSFLMEHPEFRGCAYIDDLEENLEASKQFGFRPFHFSLEKEVINKYSFSETILPAKLTQIRDFILNK